MKLKKNVPLFQLTPKTGIRRFLKPRSLEKPLAIANFGQKKRKSKKKPKKLLFFF